MNRNNPFFNRRAVNLDLTHRCAIECPNCPRQFLYRYRGLKVPGHDVKLGYGGTCFPKDVNALLSFAKKHNIELNSISGGWATNLKVRPEKDWEKKEGRSVSYKKQN